MLWSMATYSQYYNDGQDRAGIKWERISSINFEVIFPQGFEKQATRVVNLMEKSYRYTTETLHQKPKKISIILHTETVKSNAFLGWAPSRIEMYTTPHQQTYSQDWLEQLAIHEYRHMIQVSKLESEMPKLLRYLFGEQAAALLTAAYVPFWFIEGDAVSAETGLSNSGRGRLPDFHRELRAQVVDKKIYSYDKAYLGSYKDYVANYYHLGYFMVGGARMLYDKVIWDEVLHNIARKPLLLRPFDNGLKKSIGIKKVQLYDTVFHYLQDRWIKEDQQIKPTPHIVLTRNPGVHTDYRFGFFSSDSTCVAEKSSLSNIDRLVEINSKGKEKVLFTPGYYFAESVSGKDEKLVWIERLSHPRWYHSDLSLLRIFDRNTKKLNEYKFKTKLFAPAFSPDKSRIVAVEGDSDYRFFLDLIDASTGRLVKQLQIGNDDFLITPSWTADGKSILVIALRNNQKGILKVDVESGQTAVVLPFANQEITRPEEYEGNVYFIGGYTGVDNLYRIKPDGTTEEIISSRFGIADHNYRNGQILYSNYTADGYQLAKASLDSIKAKPVVLSSIQKSYPIADKLSEQEGGAIDFSVSDGIDYKSEPYRKVLHLLHFHSWAPIAIDPYSQTASMGVSLMSQNMLSTAEFVGGYRYRWQDEQGEYYAGYKYYGWYPVISAEIYSGKRQSQVDINYKYLNQNNEVVRIDTVHKNLGWDETNFTLNTYLPLDLSRGKYFRKIQPRLIYNLTNISANPDSKDFVNDGSYQTLETGIYMYQILHSSEQDLVPNLGVLLDVSYLHSLPGVADFGSMWSVASVLYLPGIGHNDGITIYNGIQHKQQMDFAFSDRIRFPRGHSHALNDQMYSFGIDYHVPLLYPDLSIWGLAYIKRLKMKMFYDFANYSSTTVQNNISTTYSGRLRSTGVELKADMHFIHFIAPMEIGFRTSYLFNGAINFDYLFNIQFTF